MLITKSALFFEPPLSVFMALCAMVQLKDGKLSMCLKGQKEPTLLEKPTWYNFIFFTDFSATRISCVERVPAKDDGFPAYTKLARQVVFYYKGKLLATVWLEGTLISPAKDEEIEEKALWTISRINYQLVFFATDPRGDRAPPPERDYEFEVTGYSNGLLAV